MEIDSQTLKLLEAIAAVLAILTYTLALPYYFTRSPVVARLNRVFGAIKFRWEGHRIPAIPYSLRYEVPAIVVASLLLNLAGWGLTSRNPNILYLDMAGTAAAAFLLGPWWGAIVGILTPVVIAEVYPVDASTILIPWMLVNVSGGVFWGLMARTERFRRYVNAEPTNVIAETKAHLSFLLWFGVIGAAVMAVAGTAVSLALKQDPSIFLRSPFFAERLQAGFITLHEQIHSMRSFAGSHTVSLFLRGVLRWAIAAFSYVPDKTISAAVGLLTAKYVFPLYESTLMRGANNNCRNGDNWLTPVIGLVCYGALLPWNISHSSPKTWLWYIPFLILGGACLLEILSAGQTSQCLIDDRTRRVDLYLAARKILPREQYFGAIVAAVSIASLVFIAGLALFGSVKNNGTIAFRFVGTVLTYCLAFYVLRISARQWTSMLSNRQSQNREIG